MLVLLSLLVLAADGLLRGRNSKITRSGPMTQRVSPPERLGRARWPVLALFAALVVLALGIPVAAALYWIAAGLPPALSGGANVSLLSAAGPSGVAGRVTVLVRPEQIDLGPNEDGVTARVTSYRYHGHAAVLYLQPGNDVEARPIVVRMAGGLIARSARR